MKHPNENIRTIKRAKKIIVGNLLQVFVRIISI